MFAKMFAIAALIVAVGICCVPAEAQQVIGGTANRELRPRQLTRGLLWHAYFNTGVEGKRAPSYYYENRYADLSYPGLIITNINANDFSEYYGNRIATGGRLEMDWYTYQARGHGWWIAAKVGGQEKVSYGSSLVKGQEESSDVFMMTVDPRVDLGGRFAKVGNEVVNPGSKRTMGKWWPGSTLPLDASEPVEILNYHIGRYNDASVDRFPEDIILSKWTTGTGITGTMAAFAWNHPDYDDFILEEWVFENTGDTNGDRKPDLPGGGHDLKNVYFAFQHRLTPSAAGNGRGHLHLWLWDFASLEGCSISGAQANAGNGQDDKLKYTEAPNYDGPASARGLKMTYSYDWDNWCLTGSLADDVGDPYRTALKPANFQVPDYTTDGELLAIAHIGVAEIDVDATDGFVGDNGVYQAPKVAQQPFAHNLFQVFRRQQNAAVESDLLVDEPDPTKMSDAVMYQMITRSPPLSYFEPLTSNSAAQARPTRGSGDLNKGVPLLPLPDNPTGPMPYAPNPEWEWKGRHGIAAGYSVMDTYGPYDLAPGQKVKLVFAYVAGAPVEENFRAFRRKRDNAELRKEENGAAFTNLVKHLRKAREAYALGYDLPNQPPDVDVTLRSSENARSELTWRDDADKSVNPDTGAPDVAGYRVYRSETLPDMWVQFADVKVGDPKYYSAASKTYRVEDLESLPGFEYFYSVRAYQKGANTGFVSRVTGRTVEGGVSAYESGPGDPSTFYYPSGGVVPISPLQVASASADRMEKRVRVIPNPYIEDGVHTYQGSNKLRIVNLPRRARIRIFSMAGDLVGEEIHESNTVGEFAYYQLNKLVTSQLGFGTYILAVESLVPESLGKVQYTKFVIVR